jgi:signal peptidase I
MSEIKTTEKKPMAKKYIIAISCFALILYFILIRILFLTYFFDVENSSHSMEPALKMNLYYRLNETAYWFNTPQRGDIVVTYSNDKELDLIVKRIIGLPGEKLQIKEGKVYINDKELKQSYLSKFIAYPGIAEKSIILKKDEYFVLGDNFDISYDSRYEEFGLIGKDYITGEIDGLSVRNLNLLYKFKIGN